MIFLASLSIGSLIIMLFFKIIGSIFNHMEIEKRSGTNTSDFNYERPKVDPSFSKNLYDSEQESINRFNNYLTNKFNASPEGQACTRILKEYTNG